MPRRQPTNARGLCRPHYRHLERQPELFEAIADPIRQKDTFRLKRDLKADICIIVQNNVGCTQSATGARRVCPYHYGALQNAGLLALVPRR